MRVDGERGVVVLVLEKGARSEENGLGVCEPGALKIVVILDGVWFGGFGLIVILALAEGGIA